uniref:Uncharacterized protein n=1 Tax=Oryctolagus cuniculus TaxID=9986 RepID=A0A5F9CY49_RABIT
MGDQEKHLAPGSCHRISTVRRPQRAGRGGHWRVNQRQKEDLSLCLSLSLSTLPVKKKKKKKGSINIYTGSNMGDPHGAIKIIRVCTQLPTAPMDVVVDTVKESSKHVSQLINPRKPPLTCLQLINLSLTLLRQLASSTLPLALYQQEYFVCAPLQEPPIAATLLSNISALTNTCTPCPQRVVGHLPLHSGGQNAACWVTNVAAEHNELVRHNIPCVTNMTVNSLSSPLGTSFLCSHTLQSCISDSTPGPCVLLVLSPHLMLYNYSEFFLQTIPSTRKRRAALLPLLAGISLEASFSSAVTSGTPLGHDVTSTNQLQEQRQQLQQITRSTETQGLQSHITSLAGVVLQNRQASDLITAGKGETCIFREEQCCYYVNQSGQVEHLKINFYIVCALIVEMM